MQNRGFSRPKIPNLLKIALDELFNRLWIHQLCSDFLLGGPFSCGCRSKRPRPAPSGDHAPSVRAGGFSTPAWSATLFAIRSAMWLKSTRRCTKLIVIAFLPIPRRRRIHTSDSHLAKTLSDMSENLGLRAKYVYLPYSPVTAFLLPPHGAAIRMNDKTQQSLSVSP